MKRVLLLFAILLTYGISFAQTSSSVVKWKYTIQEKEGKKFLLFEADITKGWHLYSQYINGDGPVPTTFSFKENKDVLLSGKVIEENAHTSYDPNFDMEISFFEGKTVFTQEILKNTNVPSVIAGTIEFMVCNDHMCYPPETIEFSIDIP